MGLSTAIHYFAILVHALKSQPLIMHVNTMLFSRQLQVVFLLITFESLCHSFFLVKRQWWMRDSVPVVKQLWSLHNGQSDTFRFPYFTLSKYLNYLEFMGINIISLKLQFSYLRFCFHSLQSCNMWKLLLAGLVEVEEFQTPYDLTPKHPKLVDFLLQNSLDWQVKQGLHLFQNGVIRRISVY